MRKKILLVGLISISLMTGAYANDNNNATGGHVVRRSKIRKEAIKIIDHNNFIILTPYKDIPNYTIEVYKEGILTYEESSELLSSNLERTIETEEGKEYSIFIYSDNKLIFSKDLNAY